MPMKNVLENFKTKIFGNRYPGVVYKIHREFYTASDKLLKEANEIIAKAAKVSLKKSERLEKLGFVKVKEVKESKEIMESVDFTKKMSEIIQMYSLKYPNNKFIIEEDVKKICEKYNLVFGNIEDFTGFVPEKNLQEIEAFQLREEDYSAIYRASLGWGDSAYGTLAEIIERWSDRWSEDSIIAAIKQGAVDGKSVTSFVFVLL
jgi:hypothetical protein